jgi:hypothetical protein
MKKGSMLANALELTTITTMIAIGSIAGALIAGTSNSITTTGAFESISGIALPINQRLAFAQESNTSSSTKILINETKGNITTTTIPTTIPTLATSGTKEFYVFTSERVTM